MRSDTALRRWKLVTEARMLSTGSGQIVEAGNALADAIAEAEARIERKDGALRQACEDLVEAEARIEAVRKVCVGRRTVATAAVVRALTGEADDE